MGLYYLGSFPPAYGGVTIKNQCLFEALDERTEIQKIDFNRIKRFHIVSFFRLLVNLLNRRNIFIVGVSGRKTRRTFCRLLYAINRKAMGQSILFLMGGAAAKDIAADKEYTKWIRSYKRVYVELKSMMQTLNRAGVDNVAIYPNARPVPRNDISPSATSAVLRCVFFSLITPEKGVDVILKAAERLPDVEFHFYGSVDRKFQNEFTQAITSLKNAQYHGVFSGTADEVYSELNPYDVLLLPTRCKGEGVPGILMEGKIAGLAEIVSDFHDNLDLVSDGADGIVLKDCTAAELAGAIERVNGDRAFLMNLKAQSRASAEQYYISKYIDGILGDIT